MNSLTYKGLKHKLTSYRTESEDNSTPMKKNMEINPAAFEKMLLWLDKNRDAAGNKYEAIRLRLIKIFDYRQCPNSEELADRVFDRVLQKIEQNAVADGGNPALYFYSVANNIYRENLRKPITVELPEDIAREEDEESFEPYYECLKKCLKKLSSEKQRLIIGYYEEEKRAKIDFRQKLAQSIGISTAKLHSRVFRIRESLQQCVLKCVEENGW
jgi:DNA-directed RNA polymerase specialized sigma24 family protein